MVAGLMLAIETIVHYTVNPGDDPHIKAFGVPLRCVQPDHLGAWRCHLSVGGFLLARKTWIRVGRAWDDATTAAREKGVARMSTPAIELRGCPKKLRQYHRSSVTSI